MRTLRSANPEAQPMVLVIILICLVSNSVDRRQCPRCTKACFPTTDLVFFLTLTQDAKSRPKGGSQMVDMDTRNHDTALLDIEAAVSEFGGDADTMTEYERERQLQMLRNR